MRIRKSILLMGLSLLLLAGCGIIKGDKANGKDVPANPIEKEGYKLIYSDEFDGDDLDTKKWLPQYFPHATSVAAGCSAKYRFEDGNICLYIDENTPNFGEHTSMKASSIQTFEKNLLHPGAGRTNVTNVVPYESFACQYGYFEMRAKIPNCGGGGHVAWWLVGTQDDAREDGTMSSQNGEIDIMETTFAYPNVFSPKVHAWDDKDLAEYKEDIGLEGDFANNYHIYAMDWTPSGIKFYVDGEEVCSTDLSPQYRMAMFLGIYTDCGGWSGDANKVWPKEFWVDYVRVYHDENGYPDGTTKDATPVVLPKDLATQLKSDMLDEEVKAQTQMNVLSSSTILLNGETGELGGLCDGDYTYGYVSPDTAVLPDEFTFSWDSPIKADTLRLSVNCALGQAPTYVEIQTKTGKSEWKSIADCNVTWITEADNFEYVDIPVDANGITDLKFIIKDANLTWKHYAIGEMKLFLEHDAEMESAKKLTSKIANGSGILPTNIAYMAETITTTGKGTGIYEIANENHIVGYVSEDNPKVPQDIEFVFDELFTIKGIRISGNCAKGQAPTLIEISIKSNGVYKSLGNYFITWQSADEVHEICDIALGTQSNVEAVKITVKRANLEWKHYAIPEIQIYE